MMEASDPHAAQYEEKLVLIKAWADDRALPTQLERRVKSHFENAYKRVTVFESAAAESTTALSPPQVTPTPCAFSFF